MARAAQERRLGGAASALAGMPVAVRCQSLGGAFVDGGPELGYVRWGADGSPEPWVLLKRDQCRHLAAYVHSPKARPSRDQVVAVHVLTHQAMRLSVAWPRRPPSARPFSATPTPPACSGPPRPTPPAWPSATGATSTR